MLKKIPINVQEVSGYHSKRFHGISEKIARNDREYSSKLLRGFFENAYNLKLIKATFYLKLSK